MPKLSYLEINQDDRFLIRSNDKVLQDVIAILSVTAWKWCSAGGTRVRYYHMSQGPEHVLIVEAQDLAEHLVALQHQGLCIKLGLTDKIPSRDALSAF